MEDLLTVSAQLAKTSAQLSPKIISLFTKEEVRRYYTEIGLMEVKMYLFKRQKKLN